MKHKLTMFLILVLAALFGAHAFARIQLSVNIAPPPIAVFDQSPCPGDGYIWTPGYYQYGDYGYYWVPGQWGIPPSVGVPNPYPTDERARKRTQLMNGWRNWRRAIAGPRLVGCFLRCAKGWQAENHGFAPSFR